MSSDTTTSASSGACGTKSSSDSSGILDAAFSAETKDLPSFVQDVSDVTSSDIPSKGASNSKTLSRSASEDTSENAVPCVKTKNLREADFPEEVKVKSEVKVKRADLVAVDTGDEDGEDRNISEEKVAIDCATSETEDMSSSAWRPGDVVW